MNINIFNRNFVSKLRETYDDYRIAGAIIKQGYSADYPYIMNLYDNDSSTIKSVNVQIGMMIGSYDTEITIKDDYGKHISMLITQTV